VDYVGVLLGFMMDMPNKAHLHKNDWHRTVFIDAGGVSATEFDLAEDKVKMLIESGRKRGPRVPVLMELCWA
jgi:NTE family protein